MPRLRSRFSVVGSVRSKRFSLPLADTRIWQGPFAPRTLLRFVATMNPADSRPEAVQRLSLPAGRCVLALRLDTPSVGSPRFPAGLSTRAAPYHPGESDRCTCPLLPCRWQASPQSGRLATLTCVTRPKRVQSLRLMPSPHEAPHPRLLRRTLARLHVEWATYMASSFQLARPARLRLAHQISQIYKPTPSVF